MKESKAIESAESVEKSPSSLFYFERGMLNQRNYQFDSAIADFSKSIEIKPSDEAYYRRGQCYYEKDRFSSAISDFTLALSLKPNCYKFYYWRGTTYLLTGMKNSDQRQFELALKDMESTITFNPKYVDAYIEKAKIYLAMGQLNPALEDLKTAIRLNAEDDYAYGIRAQIYSDEGQFDLAFDDINRAIQIATKKENIYYYVRGRIYYLKNQLDLAIVDLNEAISLGCLLPTCFAFRASAYCYTGELDKALLDYQSASEKDSDNALVLLMGALILLEKNDIKEASQIVASLLSSKCGVEGRLFAKILLKTQIKEQKEEVSLSLN